MTMKMIRLPDDLQGSAPGQAAWMMAEHGDRCAAGIAALQEWIAPGLTLVDAAEMLCEGKWGA
ncbi:hypothetical protein [Novosphingobium decolorationis]|uniref:Uncharacterized protein n=1 Tax=Novosphingobium decolorationis TaxID=2698673 RepID=A0ABX8E929_9SPHN|nr:hypothetical protein [Novosphingobium decolorationis]QVM85288.1 hypothetical protein HT578_17735 [Novosphingobium decolorationis]